MQAPNKYKPYVIGGIALISILLLLFWVGQIVLPFVFAIFLAHLVNPFILKIQKKLKSRNLSITSFLLLVTALFVGIIFFFGDHIIKDSKRMVSAVEVFTDEHKDDIKEIKNNVISFVDDVYESEMVQKQIEAVDTLAPKKKEKNVMAALESVYSFFEEPNKDLNKRKRVDWNWFLMLIYTLIYTSIILYTYEYFEGKFSKFCSTKLPTNSLINGIWEDFKRIVLTYFKQRAKVVFIGTTIFITAFSIIDLPGAIIIGIVTGLLTYAAPFHYLSLPLVGTGCWVLSIEHDNSFWLYFGILTVVYILVSVLEETLFFNKIMKSVNGMNPAIRLLSFTLWIFVFGGFVGTIVALPLTQIILISFNRIMSDSK